MMRKYWLPFVIFLLSFGLLLVDWDLPFIYLTVKKLCLISLVIIYATLVRRVIFWYIDFSSALNDEKKLLPVSIFLGLWYLAVLISFALLF
jgi:hypothetical protein